MNRLFLVLSALSFAMAFIAWATSQGWVISGFMAVSGLLLLILSFVGGKPNHEN